MLPWRALLKEVLGLFYSDLQYLGLGTYGATASDLAGTLQRRYSGVVTGRVFSEGQSNRNEDMP